MTTQRLLRMFSALAAFFSILLATPTFGSLWWTNLSSGLWTDTNNWSSAKAPGTNSGAIYITNSESKTVTIDAATPDENLKINNLRIAGPPGSTNLVLLADIGTNRPMTFLGLSGQSALAMYSQSALEVRNSSLVFTGTFGAPLYFTMWGGTLNLDGGSIIVRDEPMTKKNMIGFRLGRNDSTSPRGTSENATLNVKSGLIEAGVLLIGTSPSSMFTSEGTLNLTGGRIQILSEFAVGSDQLCTGTVLVSGGELEVPNYVTNVIRIGDHGMGRMTVARGVVTLPTVSVGRHTNAYGSLLVESNGLVAFTDDLSIGRFIGSTGAVVVAGGQLLATNSDFYVGREGAGQLTVSNGLVQAVRFWIAPTNTAIGIFSLEAGDCAIKESLVVGAAGLGTGQVMVAQGRLRVGNSRSTGFTSVEGGDLKLTGGTFITDQLWLTNAGGTLTFSGGALRSQNSTVANGAPFVVGDGVNAATFELLGGIHSFSNGLVISSNATLIGCGTILGEVTNYGTIATNCHAPSITQDLTNQTVVLGSNATFTILAEGSEPPSYQWRFKGEVIADAKAASYTVFNAQSTNAGGYDVVVSNSSGSVTSLVAQLTVVIPAVPAVITNTTVSGGNTLTFSFDSTSGQSYYIEYKHLLTDPVWLPLTNCIGDGVPIIILDTPLSDMRFYRVRTE